MRGTAGGACARSLCHDGLRTVRLGGEARRSAAGRDRLPTAQAPSGLVLRLSPGAPKAAAALIVKVPHKTQYKNLAWRNPILGSPAQGRNARHTIFFERCNRM